MKYKVYYMLLGGLGGTLTTYVDAPDSNIAKVLVENQTGGKVTSTPTPA